MTVSTQSHIQSTDQPLFIYVYILLLMTIQIHQCRSFDLSALRLPQIDRSLVDVSFEATLFSFFVLSVLCVEERLQERG